MTHFSIKEYLVSEYLRTGAASNFHLTKELSHSLITQTCLAYLSQFDKIDTLDWQTIESSPLAEYAARYWISHGRSGGIDKSDNCAMLTLSLNLFTCDGASFTNWLRIFDLDFPWRRINLERNQTDIAPPLYYAALAGLERVSKVLLERVADVNGHGGRYGNALQVASYRGNEGIVKLLLENDVDVNAQGGQCRN